MTSRSSLPKSASGSATNATSVRTLRLLAALPAAGPIVTLSKAMELSRASKTTTHRLLSSLVESGFLVRDKGGNYIIGVTLYQLAAQIYRQNDNLAVARGLLEDLAKLSGETVSLHVRNGDLRVCVEAILSPQPIVRAVRIGQVVPITEGATGRALLHGVSNPIIEDILDRQPPTITKEEFWERLEIGRHIGYHVGIEETLVGVAAISIPLEFGIGSTDRAAVTIAAPKDRITSSTILDLVPQVMSMCERWAATASVGVKDD